MNILKTANKKAGENKLVSYIFKMNSKHPTYHLGKDFPQKLEKFVLKFLTDGYEYFGEEFQKIDSFVKQARCELETNPERDDLSLRINPKEKYLLELVAFKIYDEINREEFNKRKNTLIIMPDCLSIHESECEKVETKYGSVCKRCQTDCQAYHITELARKYKVKVLFSKRSLTEQLEHHSEKMGGDMAVIGVACMMMLASGMRKANEADIPARGVLLNFTGCDHWNDNPFASKFDLAALEAILEEKYGKRD